MLLRLQEIFFSTGFCLFVCLFVEVQFMSSSSAVWLRITFKCHLQDITTQVNSGLESTNSLLPDSPKKTVQQHNLKSNRQHPLKVYPNVMQSVKKSSFFAIRNKNQCFSVIHCSFFNIPCGESSSLKVLLCSRQAWASWKSSAAIFCPAALFLFEFSEGFFFF